MHNIIHGIEGNVQTLKERVIAYEEEDNIDDDFCSNGYDQCQSSIQLYQYD